MNESHIVWSGQACPFRRAGVYYGLCAINTQERIAQWLLPRRGSVYCGGRIHVRPGDPCPLVYLAVRDPSAVRVVPVRADGLRGGKSPVDEFAHVSLVFTLDKNRSTTPASPGHSPQDQAALDGLALDAAASQHGGFIVSIGLRIDREREFHERLVLAHMDLPYAQLCERIMALREEFSK